MKITASVALTLRLSPIKHRNKQDDFKLNLLHNDMIAPAHGIVCLGEQPFILFLQLIPLLIPQYHSIGQDLYFLVRGFPVCDIKVT